MGVQGIIAYWLSKFQYKHNRKVYKTKLCNERIGFYCASPYCKRHAYRWERKHLNKLLSAKDKQAYRLILPVGDILPPYMLAQVWENFTKKLRRLYPDCEWYWILELQGENLHYHVILTTGYEVSEDKVTDKWLKTLARKNVKPHHTVLVTKVDDYEKVAGYSIKCGWKDSVTKRPPSGLYRIIALGSRGFCTK